MLSIEKIWPDRHYIDVFGDETVQQCYEVAQAANFKVSRGDVRAHLFGSDSNSVLLVRNREIIKGFAISLAIGVFSSVFTALFVSRLIFDFNTEVLKKQTISIRWGNK